MLSIARIYVRVRKITESIVESTVDCRKLTQFIEEVL